ncbi:MAG: GatB/YqeY domain-containing protein [Rhizomicrobium sp.]
MALKDQLTEALNSTPADNTRRIATLREVLAAAEAREGATDADLSAIIARIITEREQRAASFSAAGQSDLAKAERGEIGTLRSFLRATAPVEPAAAPKKVKADVPKAAAEFAFTTTQLIIVGAAVGAVAIAAILYFFVFSSNSDNGMLLTGSTKTAVSVLKDDRTIGNPGAPITMLEYAAPVCPHCARFNETVMPLIKKNYIDTGKIFYIFRVFPLQPADGAAEAIARCLPADKYFQFIDLLFRNQAKWDPEYGITDVRGALIQMARIAGMSPEKVDACISDKDEQDRINNVALDGQTKYDIQGTPTFIINGVKLEAGVPTYDQMQTRFDSLLSKH